MHDIKFIREHPETFDKAMARRGLGAQSENILSLDEQRRAIQTQLQGLQAERNEKSKMIGQVKRDGGDTQAIMDEVASMKTLMGELEEKERGIAGVLQQHLMSLPNMMADDVPDGVDEDENVEIRKHGDAGMPNGANNVPEHYEIGENLGMMDFETAVKMAGSRFTMLSSGLARLERALAQFFLDTHTQDHGYVECSPPLLVKDSALYGTGQLPKFADDQFKMVENEHVFIEDVEVIVKPAGQVGGEPSWQVTPKDPSDKAVSEILDKADEVQVMEGASGPKRVLVRNRRWAIPTAEVSLTNIAAERIMEAESLPLRLTAFTPCFRSEAGSAGRDTRGMIRQHQFYKVEMVSITTPDQSKEEHERMTQCAETVLQKLGLSYRTVILCSGDTGFGAQKTYDIEVWLPGQGRYREISSCSNCGDFQARRMNARFRTKDEKNTQFLHTLNGSGVAVGRALIAVMENYYDPADGGIFVPDVLKPYMAGVEKITVPVQA